MRVFIVPRKYYWCVLHFGANYLCKSALERDDLQIKLPLKWWSLQSSFVPRPHPKNRERGLVTLANFPVCAESAYYVTISCLTWSRGSQLLFTMALQSRWADLAAGKPCEARLVAYKYALTFWNLRFVKGLLALFPFLSGLGTSLLSSCVKIVVIENAWMWFLYSKQRLLTQHIWEFLQAFPNF